MYLFILLVLCCSSEVTSSLLKNSWQEWKLEHSKVYSNLVEEEAHRDVWVQNYHQILSQHEKSKQKFFITLNQFSDLVSNLLGDIL